MKGFSDHSFLPAFLPRKHWVLRRLYLLRLFQMSDPVRLTCLCIIKMVLSAVFLSNATILWVLSSTPINSLPPSVLAKATMVLSQPISSFFHHRFFLPLLFLYILLFYPLNHTPETVLQCAFSHPPYSLRMV